MNDEIVELQMKLSFQDSLLEELNQVVTDQQQQISRMELALESLRAQVQTMHTAQMVNEPNEPPPPHY
ncbi:MAG: SlyX family protein [Gammaproteobacteria bacterium]|nr:SlyX family protein [Gammaproteobacteria bacterium]